MTTLRPGSSYTEVGVLCYGSGRFLRGAIVPFFEHLGVMILQPRGRSLVEAMMSKAQVEQERPLQSDSNVMSGGYEIDIVRENGEVEVRTIGVLGVGCASDRDEFLGLPQKLVNLKYILVGVTEAGMQPGSQAMQDLGDFLFQMSGRENVISVIDCDNVPGNGNVIRENVLSLSLGDEFNAWVNNHVVFHNTMVDRITNFRNGNTFVPRMESWDRKVLVIEDLKGVIDDLDGAIIRRNVGEIDIDHAIKLRVSNAIHTALVYAMCLGQINTTMGGINNLLMEYLNRLYASDIRPGFNGICDLDMVDEAYEDWINRLMHPHFGMSTFFVSQNAMFKIGARLMPSVLNVIGGNGVPSKYMAFALACILRFLTPCGVQLLGDGVFSGKMDPGVGMGNESYAGGLMANFEQGLYEFRDSTGVAGILMSTCHSFDDVVQMVQVCLGGVNGWHEDVKLCQLSFQVANLYQQLKDGSVFGVLHDLLMGHVEEIEMEQLSGVLWDEINSRQVVDLHTHLFPPSHGDLMLWGIDELLTYHYLVSEYLMIGLPAEEFNELAKEQQAELVWGELFVSKSPISEACRGVLTVLQKLGLEREVCSRDLNAIRQWFNKQDPDEYCRVVFQLAGVKYVVMTNIPYELEEARQWREEKIVPGYFKAALRVDKFLLGDWSVIDGHEQTVEGAKAYLREWIGIMNPVYLMASVPLEYNAEYMDQVIIPIAREFNLAIAMKFGADRQINPSYGLAGDGMQLVDMGIIKGLCQNYPDVKFLVTILAEVQQHELCVLSNKFANLHCYGSWWNCNIPSIIDHVTRMRMEMLGFNFTYQHSDARVLDQLIYKWNTNRRILHQVMLENYELLMQTGWVLTRDEVKRDLGLLMGDSYERFLGVSE